MKLFTYSTFHLIFLLGTIFSQTNSTRNFNFDEAYFGQTPPGLLPEVFAPGIISTYEFEFSGTFSPDGKEYYFTRRSTYEGSENRIFYSQFINSEWTKPVLAPFAKDIFEFEPVLFPSGKKLVFFSERREERSDQYSGNLWITENTVDGWSNPQHFESPANMGFCMSVSSTNDGTIYFSNILNGKRGLFLSKFINEQFTEAEYLPETINSDYYSHPFIAPDESYIIIDAQPSGRGNPELFISFRRDDGAWTKPVNMGEAINSTKTEFAGSVSPDGKYFFFHRRVNGNGDIYWVDAKVIYDLKPQI